MTIGKIVTERQAFAGCKSSARKRDISFDLTFHEFLTIIKQECFYCGIAPSRSLRAYNTSTKESIVVSRSGIDRLDNDQGYVIENCVPCCMRCNTMKMNMPLEEFFERVSRIYHLHIGGTSD